MLTNRQCYAAKVTFVSYISGVTFAACNNLEYFKINRKSRFKKLPDILSREISEMEFFIVVPVNRREAISRP